MNFNFAGKIALVTGASSGIGSAVSKLLSRCGAQLVITGRNKDNLQKISKQCVNSSPDNQQPLIVEADISKSSHCEKIMEETLKSYEKLDILVNSAGIIMPGTCEDSSLETFDTQMNTNVRSMFYLTQIAIPSLIATKGNVVNVSSVNGLRSFSGVNVYCMTKAAVDQFTRCTALELALKGVRVNAVNPGVIETELHLRMGMDDDKYKQFLERCKETHALGRHGNPEEVASAIAFLASDHASFITGATLPVDGGRHAMCPR